MQTAISIIKRDHRGVELEYKKFQAAESDSQRRAIALEIFDALEQHARMEEELFYPVVRDEGSSKAAGMIDEAYNEHTEIQELLERFRDEIDEEGLAMKMDELMAGVAHHVREEERELLTEVDRSMSRARLIELADEMDAWSPTAGVDFVDEVTERLKIERDILLG